MVRKFLYIMAGFVALLLAGAAALRIFASDLTEIAFVPSAEFSDLPALPAASYDNPDMWLARPGMGERDPARWVPPGFMAGDGDDAATKVEAAVFFLHPTGLVSRDSWNAALDDKASQQRSRLFVQGMASPFNASDNVWAPRYRQAAIGAFLTDVPEADRALDLAYRDVRQAFETFLASIKPDQPIVLAGHSQGALHLRRLIAERIAGTPVASRLAVAYIIGWPVSVPGDLPAMKMPACTDASSTGCVVSWLTFADPPETEMLMRAYARRLSLNGGTSGRPGPFVCVNPISGVEGGTAPAADNLGTLIPDLERGTGVLVTGAVPARCGEDGLLNIGAPPELDMGPYVLPGNNYHLYDITLFWANLRQDFERRVAAFRAGKKP